LNNLQPEMVFRGGTLVAENGAMIVERQQLRKIDLRSTINVKMDSLDFSIPAQGDFIRVIGAVGDQVVTGHLTEPATIVDGEAVADPSRDILKIAVVERHKASGNIGKGFIKGFGLKRGALAGTVAHDHHNLVVIGADDESMRLAVHAVNDMGGGVVVIDDGEVVAHLALPVAGLMSEEPIDSVRRDYDALIAAAQNMGSSMPDPLMAMSFMGLEVIPKLKLTDVGLVDVEQFAVVDLFV
jgi:adenine deaminase